MQLTPTTYECPTHHVDLTARVHAILDEDGPPIAYGKRPFRVKVSCPGPDAHTLMCSGEREP